LRLELLLDEARSAVRRRAVRPCTVHRAAELLGACYAAAGEARTVSALAHPGQLGTDAPTALGVLRSLDVDDDVDVIAAEELLIRLQDHLVILVEHVGLRRVGRLDEEHTAILLL